MTIGEADKEFNSIMALIQEVHRICQQYGISIGLENPYSYITGQVGQPISSFNCMSEQLEKITAR